MTRITRTKPAGLRRLATRVAIVVTALVGALGAAVVAPSTAAAHSPTTSLPDVASAANRALWLSVQWENTGDLTDYTTYVRARLEAAESTANQYGLSTAKLDAEWGAIELSKQQAVLAAMSQLGVPYRSRMSKVGKGFDCSGLVLFAYSQAGIELPRSSRDQIRAATEVDRANLEPGDLVYYPGHISMYLGSDFVVHSPQPGEFVEIREMFDRSLRFGDATEPKP